MHVLQRSGVDLHTLTLLPPEDARGSKLRGVLVFHHGFTDHCGRHVPGEGCRRIPWPSCPSVAGAPKPEGDGSRVVGLVVSLVCEPLLGGRFACACPRDTRCRVLERRKGEVRGAGW